MSETLRERKKRILQNKTNYFNNKKGVLSNLGSIGQFIADDTNNLDNLSFATDKGLKVNLSNNRNKEVGEPKVKLEDMDFSGLSSVGANVNTQDFDQELESEMQPRWNGLTRNKDNAATSFIKTNSAVADFEPYYFPLSDGEEWYVESREEEEFLKNSTRDERAAYTSLSEEDAAAFLANRRPPKNRFGHELGYEEPLPSGMNALYPENTDLDPLYSLLDPLERDSLITDDAGMVKTELSEYEEALADGDMDLAKQIREQKHADNKQRFEELKVLYPNQALLSKYYPDMDYGDADLIAQVKAKNDENLAGNRFNWWNPTGSTIGFEENAENSNKYSTGGDFGPLGWNGVHLDEEAIRNVNNANLSKLDDDALIFEDMYRDRGDNEASDISLLGDDIDANPLDNVIGDNITGEDNESFDEFTYTDDIDANPLDNVIEDQIISEDNVITDDGTETEVPKETIQMMDEQQNYEVVTPEAIAEEQFQTDNAAAVLTSDNYRNEDGSSQTEEAKVEADKIIKEVVEGKTTQEEGETGLSNIFGWLTDLFGVDDKSLLRAFVKYVGGRLFGLSSGKAAAFAWKGVEQDMATEAAKGAEARKYEDNMAEYGNMYDEAIAAGDFEKAERILRKMDDLSGIDRTDAEKYEENMTKYDELYDAAIAAEDFEAAERIFRKRDELSGIDRTDAEDYYDNIEYLEGKLAKAMADGDKPEMVKAITAQLKRYREGGIDGTGTTPEATYDVVVQDENGNEKFLNARNGPNGREVQMPNGEFVPLKDYKADGFGSIVHASKVNASDAKPVPFQLAGGRYNSETDAQFESLIDEIDAKVEAGTMTEDDAFYERVKVQNSNNNRNSDGELYVKKVPFVTSISNSGVVSFPEFKGDEKRAAYQLAEGVRGLAKLQAIQANPKAMAMVNDWTAQWESIATGNAMDFGMISSYISKNYRANPLQQAYYMGMLELTTSKLRRDTGAAYNMKEMYDTMTRYTNYKDASSEVTEMRLSGAAVDLEAIAGMTRSGQYWLGVMDGTYRPSDSWQNMMGSIYTMMENEGAYTSSGDNGSTRTFSEYD